MSTASLPGLLKTLRGSRPVDSLASELGVARSTVYGWEAEPGTRQYRRIDPANLQALLTYYGVAVGSSEWISVWAALADAPVSDQSAPNQAA